MKSKYRIIDNPEAICPWTVVEPIPSKYPDPGSTEVIVWAEFRIRKDARAYKNLIGYRKALTSKTI